MAPLQKKIKRLAPIHKIRQETLDAEARRLELIKIEKAEAVLRLRNMQNQYVAGVEILNQERQAGSIDKLLILEQGLDLVKEKWHQALRELREVEAEVRLQTAQVVIARVQVKSLEKLNERYQKQLNIENSKTEAKMIDQMALRGFLQDRKGG